jgi:DNA-directed RNA polymerase subunit RPC12/RpoP
MWGHHVDNRVFKATAEHHRRCRCGADYLAEDRSITRVRHTLSCFLGTHHYEKLADRDGCHEYVCVQCGHPLLFPAGYDPYADAATFRKKVRYLCGLFGHRAQHVATRQGLEEYACFCGHSFLKHARVAGTIRHPARCVVSGHFIHFLTRRGGFAEYVCVNCGHPFCFADPQPRKGRPTLYSRHDTGHRGHVHGAEVHQSVPAVVGTAHRIR